MIKQQYLCSQSTTYLKICQAALFQLNFWTGWWWQCCRIQLRVCCFRNSFSSRCSHKTHYYYRNKQVGINKETQEELEDWKISIHKIM